MGDAEFTARRTHALHRAVGMLMDKVCAPGIGILRDSACESLDTELVQRLPLLWSKEKRRCNQFTQDKENSHHSAVSLNLGSGPENVRIQTLEASFIASQAYVNP